MRCKFLYKGTIRVLTPKITNDPRAPTTVEPLSHLRLNWSPHPESDRGPHPYHGCALPTEL